MIQKVSHLLLFEIEGLLLYSTDGLEIACRHLFVPPGESDNDRFLLKSLKQQIERIQLDDVDLLDVDLQVEYNDFIWHGVYTSQCLQCRLETFEILGVTPC